MLTYVKTVPGQVVHALKVQADKPLGKMLVVKSNDASQIFSFYLHNVVTYYTLSDQFEIYDQYCDFSADDFKALVLKMDTLVVVDENLSFKDMFKEHFGMALKPGVYEVASLLG